MVVACEVPGYEQYTVCMYTCLHRVYAGCLDLYLKMMTRWWRFLICTWGNVLCHRVINTIWLIWSITVMVSLFWRTVLHIPCIVCVSLQWHWPGAVWASPLTWHGGSPALPCLQEHAAGSGCSLGPPRLSPHSPGGPAADGHQQHVISHRCCTWSQTQVGKIHQWCPNRWTYIPGGTSTVDRG